MTPETVSLSISKLPENDADAIDQLGNVYLEIKREISKSIVGQDEAVERILVALFSRGHALIKGVPGLAKTLLVSSVAQCLDLEFSRIQFTPDLMPSDITGTDIIQEDASGKRSFEFIKGPIFTNILLADEINRAPAKTQSAMLEAMQEIRVTALGHSYKLDTPFFVLATQNPIEQEGTYPLPEAQLDRFMFLIEVAYPSEIEELEIARRTTGATQRKIETVIDRTKILAYQDLVRRVPVPDHIYEYAVALVRATRPGSESAPDWIDNYVAWGAGPRAVQYLILGAKSRAALMGSYMVRLEDIESVAESVLTHRVITRFTADSIGMTPHKIVKRLIDELQTEH